MLSPPETSCMNEVLLADVIKRTKYKGELIMQKYALKFVCLMALLIMLGCSFVVEAEAEIQKAIFPMQNEINVGQAYGPTSFSHQPAGCRAVDFSAAAPTDMGYVYAPFDCKIVNKLIGNKYGNVLFFQSLEEVLCADGQKRFVSFLLVHCNDADIGKYNKEIDHEYKQGELIYEQGNSGFSKGIHVHIECAEGKQTYYYSNTQEIGTNGETQTAYFANAIDPKDIFFVDQSVTSINSANSTFYSEWNRKAWQPLGESDNSLTFSILPSSSGSIIAKKPDLVDLNVYGDNTVTSGTVISLTANPKEGYDFIGWSATKGRFADSTSATTTFTMPASDTVITANFAEKTAPKYQLTLSAGTGGTVNTSAAGSYAAGAKINLSATASAGYAFVDWTISGGSIEDQDAATTVFTMPEGAATVTANFEPVYALTINAETGGTVTQGTSGSYPEGKTISLEAQPNNGYEFWKWTTSNGGSFNYPNSSYTTFTMPAQATTVTAHFKQPTITEWTSTSAEALLGPDAKVKGRVEFASDRKVVEVGCYLGIDPNEVLLVNGGGFDGSTPVYKVSNKVDAGIASQQGDGYRYLDVSFTAAGRNTQSNASTPDAAGFGLTALEPETQYYYMFYVVLDDGSTVQSAMSTDEVGEFKSYGNVQHSLTVKATEGGSVNGSFDGSYVAGQKINLSAQAASGYVFSHWSSDYSDWNGSYFENITSATGCVFSMPNADVTVTACFVPAAPAAKYNLTLQADEGGMITSGASGQYDETATMSIAAQAKPGYSFVKWETTAGTFTDMYSPSTVFAMTSSDAVVTAKFGSNAANIAVSPLTHDFGKVDQLSLGVFVQYKTITVTNNGSQAVTLVPKSGQSFMFENAKPIHVEAGEDATLFVQPYDTLTPGTYSETLRIENHEGLTAASVELSIEITASTPGSYAALSISPFEVGEFGEWYVGSAQPAARTVTVRYVGTEDIVLEQPTLENYGDYFTVGTLSKSTLSPNETATFTIQPKTSIPLGYHSTMVQIKGTTQYGGQNVALSAMKGVSIHVQKAAVAASPTSIRFGTLPVGYTVPAEQVISLTNTGNTWINVEIPQPVLSSFDITATRTPERWPSDGLQISLGSSFLISVKPKEGLPEGIYNETLCVPLETPNGMLVVNVPLNVTIGAGSSIPVAPTIMTDSLPNGTVGVAYSQTLVSTGDAPIVWSAEGTLPAGLTLSSSGIISGTPIAAGTATFTVKASNGIAPDATKQLSITIESASTPPAMPVTIGPSATILAGQAPITNITIGAGIDGVSAANFDKLLIDGQLVLPGTDTFDVRTGSIILQMNPSYLNTLALGRHEVRVFLKGQGFEGVNVSTTITVVSTASGTDTPPKTGDDTPLLFYTVLMSASLMLGLWMRKGKKNSIN